MSAPIENPMSILLIDDDPTFIEIFKSLVHDIQFDIIHYNDGVKALDHITKDLGHFDWIFVDWMLPRLNGLEITKCIRHFEALHGKERTPIVLLTAYTSFWPDDEPRKSGCDAVLTKPISRVSIREVMSTNVIP
jgi:CheY-like chemotaxis protein